MINISSSLKICMEFEMKLYVFYNLVNYYCKDCLKK